MAGAASRGARRNTERRARFAGVNRKAGRAEGRSWEGDQPSTSLARMLFFMASEARPQKQSELPNSPRSLALHSCSPLARDHAQRRSPAPRPSLLSDLRSFGPSCSPLRAKTKRPPAGCWRPSSKTRLITARVAEPARARRRQPSALPDIRRPTHQGASARGNRR